MGEGGMEGEIGVLRGKSLQCCCSFEPGREGCRGGGRRLLLLLSESMIEGGKRVMGAAWRREREEGTGGSNSSELEWGTR